MVLGTKQYATRQQFELLKKFKRLGTPLEKGLTRDLWLNNRQALELGYDVPEGEDFLLSPLEEEELFGRIPTPEIAPVEAVLSVMPEPELEVESLLERLYPEVTVEETIQMFAELEISEVMPPGERLRAELAQDAFLDNIIARGRNEDTEALLRMLEVDEETIDAIFDEPETKWWTKEFWLEKFFRPYGGEDLKGKAAASFIAGIGDVVSTAGGAARWLGYEGAGKALSAIGSPLQRVAPPDTSGEFEITDLGDPEFYATTIVRAIPFSLSLIPLGLGGYSIGGSAAAAFGLRLFWRRIIGGLAGAALSRPAESALEAGGSYDDAIARGKTEKEAREEADEVFRNQMLLVGADAFQIAIALAPTPKWVPSSLIKQGLVRTARVGGKVMIVGLSEGGEEVYQDMIQRRARGEDWQLDPISKEVFAIGFIMGAGMGLGGDVLSGVVSKSQDNMGASLRKRFNDIKSRFREEGFTEEQAEVRALDEVMDTPEGDKAVKDAVEEQKVEVPVEEIPTIEPEVAPEPVVTPEVKEFEALPIEEKTRIHAEADKIAAAEIRELPEYQALVEKDKEWQRTHPGMATSPYYEQMIDLYMPRFDAAVDRIMGVQPKPEVVPTPVVEPVVTPEVIPPAVEEVRVEPKVPQVVDGVRTSQIEARQAEIEKLLLTKGRLPKGVGTKAELNIEKATLEAEKDLIIIDTLEELESSIAEVEKEMGTRTLPYRAGVKAGPWAGWTTVQLDEVLRVYEEARPDIMRKQFPPEVAPPVKPVEEVVLVEPVKPSIEETTQKELAIQKTKQDTFVETKETENITKAGVDAINAQSEFAGLPPPNIPPGVTGHIGAGGKNSENNLYDMTNRIIPGEDAGRAALRLWDGTRNRMATETIAWWRKGNKTLKDLNIGKTDGRNQRLTEEDSLELFKALHGEGDVPTNLQSVFDDLKTLLDQEASDMLAFDPTFSRVLMAHPDYFPRGWRPPTEARRLKLGAKPGFLKPRVDATFTEMIEAGWEPISWNPYDMLALRRMSGTEYREGQILITRLKTFSKAIAEHDAPRDGWRVPKVGPAFEGKPYVGNDGKAYMTPKVSVPNNVADVLESIYGVKIEFRVLGVDIWKPISAFGQVTKRAKLFMSLFQHVDFLTRDWMIAFTPEGIRRALPLKFPALAARVSASAVSPHVRGLLERRILSGDHLYVDSDISLKMVADKGWKLGQDELLIRRDVREQLEAIVKEAQEEGLKVRWFQRAGQGVVKVTDPVTRRLAATARFFEAGLFDGVYRESQAYALEQVIIPRLRRLHPDWTSEQIAGSSAEEVNKQFSTLAVWQSAVQQPATREFVRTMFFSWNESESWVRQATSAVKGENAVYWREYTIAMFVALAVAANVINMIAEDEPLPLDRYVPFQLGNPYSPMPWGIAYNDKFLSPRLPWNGRNGQPIYLDIVGQADTWLRWILDPAGALTARVNVFPRALINQIQGEDFWGRELKDWDDRVKQAVLDLFTPIGAGNLLEVARLQWPEVAEVLPEAEGRIGFVGSLIQATGLNVRSIKTRDMLDKFARESGLKKADGTPVKTWSDLEPSQRRKLEKNETLQRELGLRSVTAVERQYLGAEGFAKLGKIDQERITRGEALVAELVGDLIGADRTEMFDTARAFRMEFSRLKKEISDRKSQVDEDYQLFKDTGELPDDLNKRALVEYYDIFEKAKRPSGVMDWERVNELELALRDKWTPAQGAYVDRNIRITEWGPLMQEFVDVQRVLGDSGYWDVPEIDRRVFRFQYDEIEDILAGKFYNYKPIEEEAEKLGLKWQDVYRQIDAMREKYKEMSDVEINKVPAPELITREDWEGMNPDRKRDALMDYDQEAIYNENPGFWEDDRRKKAWNTVGDLLDEKRSLVFVSEFVGYSNIVREFSPNSPHAKLYRFDSKELDALGIHEEGFDWDDLEESKVPVWRIDVKYTKEDDEYQVILDKFEGREETAEVKAYLQGEGLEGITLKRRIEYRKDRRRRAMFRLDAPDTLVNEFVDYGEVIDEFSASSSQAKLFRFKHLGLQAFMEKEEKWESLKVDEAPIWQIDVDFEEEDNARQAILDKYEDLVKQADAINAFFAENSIYHKKYYEREALQKNFPRVDEYVEWYTDSILKRPDDLDATLPFYEDDWYLMEHDKFYKAMLKAAIFTKRRDYRLVPMKDGKPDRVVGADYIGYKELLLEDALGSELDQYRIDHLEMDLWAVSVGIWKTTMTEQRRRLGITPQERFEEDIAKIRAETERLKEEAEEQEKELVK